MRLGQFDIIITEIPDSSDNYSEAHQFDSVIDFGDQYKKTLLMVIKDHSIAKRIALIVPYYTPSDACALPLGEKLFLMLNDILCVFNPVTERIDLEKHIDPMGTMFEAHAFGEDFILYGETDIYRVDNDLNIKWRFSARDIFVRQSGREPAFQMKEDRICLYDFWENYYEIDYDGNLLLDVPSANPVG